MSTEALELSEGDTLAVLQGLTVHGGTIRGGDSVRRICHVRILVALMAIGLGLTACFSAVTPTSASTATPLISPVSAKVEEGGTPSEVLATGAELYTAHCQSCHGDQDGKGGTGAPTHGEAGHTWHHPDAQLIGWILHGMLSGLMPAFQEKLAEGDPETLLAFIRSWWTPDQQMAQQDISRRYQEALDKQQTGQ